MTIRHLVILLLSVAASSCSAEYDSAFYNESYPCLQSFLSRYDTDSDGYLNSEEASAVTFLDCSSNSLAALDCLGCFPNLDSLDCSGNRLTSLNLSQCPQLTYLKCSGNLLESLDVSRTELTELYCSPMSDGKNVNCLKFLYVRRGQSIPNVTSSRSPSNVPDGTVIISIP